MRFRCGLADDIDPCLQLLRSVGCWRASDRVWAAWPDLVTRGIADGTLIFQIFEGPDSATPARPAAFRISAFVDQPFAQAFASTPYAYVSAGIWEASLDGCSPLLGRAQIADQNACGNLHLGILHWCVSNRDPRSPVTMQVLSQVPSAWQAAHAGYHVAAIAFYEVYGLAHAAIMQNIGYHAYWALQEPGVPNSGSGSDDSPFCFHARRDDAMLGAAALMSLSIFHGRRPRFGLSPGEQRIALAALDGAVDRRLAGELGIAYDSVRKAWESIYRRVAAVDSSLLPDTGQGSSRRGAEKRRVLIELLRQHMEELRPFNRRLAAAVEATESSQAGS